MEKPQFQALFDRFGVRSVLDASCGTGHHLRLFASMGIDVGGADISPAMVELARENTRKAGYSIEVSVSSWAELPEKVSRRFDAVLCIGNSLPYVIDEGDLRKSLRGLWSCVKDGGILLVQFKNFEKLRRAGERFLPIVSTEGPHETVGLRMYDYYPDKIDFHVILLEKIDREWRMRRHVTPLKPYASEDIVAPLHGLGVTVNVYGSLGLGPFVVEESPDVVIVAQHTESVTS